ncbi:MAG TPA: hypothetical protein VMR70_18880 [Flavisolibacter sp.]|nr:hypothetical protein [Flavisolibacter sp.]
MNIEDNLNEKTSGMLENLKAQGYYVELEVNRKYTPQLKGAWGMVPVYKIVSQNDEPNPAAFTHELLHVYLFTQGFVDGEKVYREVFRENHLLSPGWIREINNTLAHFKMVHLFIKLDFAKEQFFKGTPLDEWKHLRKFLLQIQPRTRDTIQQFVTAHATLRLLKDFFAIDTSEGEAHLAQVDTTLFGICDEVIDRWIAVTDADNLRWYLNLRDRLQALLTDQ